MAVSFGRVAVPRVRDSDVLTMSIEYNGVSIVPRFGSSELLPAPGRGQYDRRLPRERRLAEQRQRLIAATARALVMSDAPSVAEVVGIAGTGRNTFYEYFDDVPHAQAAARTYALKLVDQALRGAEEKTRTPVERFRALAGAWLDVATETPCELHLALRAPRGGGLSAAGSMFEGALARALETIRASGVRVPDRETLRATAVAAAAEAFARLLGARALEDASGKPAGAPAEQAPPDRARLERVLVDVAVRLLR
jgi:hypothetical protein